MTLSGLLSIKPYTVRLLISGGLLALAEGEFRAHAIKASGAASLGRPSSG